MQYTYEALGRILSLFHHHACPQWRREADIRSFISFVPRREYEARKETGISRQKEEMQKYRHKGGGKKGGKEDIVKQKTQSDSGHACCFFNLPKYRHVTVMYNIKKLSNPVINREKKKRMYVMCALMSPFSLLKITKDLKILTRLLLSGVEIPVKRNASLNSL